VNKLNSWNNIPDKQPNTKPLFLKDNNIFHETSENLLPRGLGRSYGDVCLIEDGTLALTNFKKRIIDFDEEKGIINCESGISINEILKLITPSGWFLPIVPGTSYVTIGGAIANDIHGKNHHNKGSFGNWVLSFEILLSSGEVLNCSKDNNTEHFNATIGGLGLTGLILSVRIQLIKISNEFIDSGSIRFYSLDEFFQINEEMEKQYEYTVAWVDFNPTKSYGLRGVYHYGNHSKKQNIKKSFNPNGFRISLPITPPISLVNNFTLSLLNNIYFLINKNKTLKLQSYKSFFFPLDIIKNWNKAYGVKGFYQYQFVVPTKAAYNVIDEIINEFKEANQRPALGVLKSFGNIESNGILSFPEKGLTLAIDLQNKGNTTLELMNKLDEIILSFGGKLYPAKDCRMSSSTFKKMYPQIDSFKKYKDPKISSLFYKRVIK
jgi:FAD/FMN-containing dehydrogenase